MKTFEIIFEFDAEQMYCTACSGTIRGSLENTLKENKYAYSFVAADYRSKTAEIQLQAENKVAADLIVKKLSADLEDCGKPIKKHIINDCEEMMGDHLPILNNSSGFSSKECFTSGFALSAGLTLMVLEHLSILPKRNDEKGTLANFLIGAIATALSAWVGRDSFLNAMRAIRAKSCAGAMDYLIILGSLSAITYSFLLIQPPSFLSEAEDESFFSVPLVVLGLVKLSHALRDYIHAKVESEIDVISDSKRSLPFTADVVAIPDGMEIKRIEAKQIEGLIGEKKVESHNIYRIPKDSILRIEPHGTVPIDGFLLNSDEIPVKEVFYGKKGEIIKKPNDLIYAGTLNSSGKDIYLKTVCDAKENQITKAYFSVKKNDNADNSYLNTVAKYFFPTVLAIAVLSSVGWAMWGPAPAISYAVEAFMSVMFSACPCAFGLIHVIPSVARSLAFQHGILIKSENISAINKITDICFDKCGTVTTGKYAISGWHFPFDEKIDEAALKKEYLSYAVALEQQIAKENRSAIANAIIEADPTLDLKGYSCTKFTTNPINANRGGIAIINDKEVVLGNKPLLENQGIHVDDAWLGSAKLLSTHVKLPIFLAIDKKVCALLILESVPEQQQVLRSDVTPTLRWLMQQGKQLHFLTGDSAERTSALLENLNLTADEKNQIHLAAQKTPVEKVEYIKELQQKGSVIMVGDDDNDTAAIAQANIGIAIDTVAPVRENAAAVLNGSLYGLVQLMQLSEIQRQANIAAIAIAFGVNSLAIITGAGALYPVIHMMLDPMILGGVMACSSLLLMMAISVFKCRGLSVLASKNIQFWQQAPVNERTQLLPASAVSQDPGVVITVAKP